MSDIEVRRATAAEATVLAALQEASREAIALCGSRANADALALLWLRYALDHDAVVLVAERDKTPLGFAQLRPPGGNAELPEMAKLCIKSIGIVGSLKAGRGLLVRRPADFDSPEGGVHLSELQVDVAARGQGVGGVLLDAVDAIAEEEHAPHISLTTAIDNPARRLYERHGYDVTAEKRNARYEKLTGHPGRILMVKAFG